MIDIQKLLEEILQSYSLPWRGAHGISHWARVLENGLRLAESTHADKDVVTLFALFHDSKRVSEYQDPQHGKRGAEFALAMRNKLFELSDHQFDLLYTACELHTNGLIEGDVTLQTCWDADRLDLGRVGIRINPAKLCTTAAKSKEILDWAQQRATKQVVPDIVKSIWEQDRGLNRK
ncbi:hypothetical protein [Candidatus Uabimicrobium amorphum]|uniref:HD domain-containing protein n=1 Tax=Uabimicrobium amorphum TaxID=2596890 RepID=A0A5S9F630_UABAM|nr:hypothetical protein [Candidatus Uabimicrobium amorphum]BBM87248.1 hypothetical protein UABAM_05651 [Candidatus Uabimicrobium amorphum]